MKEVTFTVTLSLAGPIITGSTAAGDFGVDLPFAQDNDGQCYLPGTQVKGRLREAIQMLSQFVGLSSDDLNDWFGQKSQEDKDNQPERGRLIFGDFVSRHLRLDAVRTRIRIDPARGAVEEGAYQVIEAPFAAGDEIDFKGAIRFFCRDGELLKFREAIEKGLRWIPALGGQRSIGFGRLTKVKIDESSRDAPSAANLPASCDALQLTLYPQAPFCIARPRVKENLFESEAIIPGGVLKGCLANTLNQILSRPLNTGIDEQVPPPWDKLGRHFSRLRFDHAFPAPEGKTGRPRHHPLSLVRAGETTYDVALCKGSGLIKGQAPAFLADWKPSDFEAVGREFGWDDPPSTLRVRTAMDSGTRRAAEGQLFAYEMVVSQGYVWHSRLDLTQVPAEERAEVRSQLEELLRFGMKYLGKTKTDVMVNVSPSSSQPIPTPLENHLWVITLQTPALMADPKKLTDPQALVDPSILFQAYREFWTEASDNGLELVHFFAQQRLFGGEYLRHRFQPGKPYNPFLITVERSVFVLKLSNPSRQEDMKRKLGLWLSRGLPLPEWAKETYGESWQTCPFVPENGFGEVAINMDCHQKNRPDAGIYTEV